MSGRKRILNGLFVGLLVLSASPAAAQFPACLTDPERAVIVEPLNAQVIRTTTPNFGSELVFAVNPAVCGTCSATTSRSCKATSDCPLGESCIPIPEGCYEFGVLPVEYTGPTSPVVLQAGVVPLIEGAIQVEVQPVAGTEPSDVLGRIGDPPRGTWDGVSRVSMPVDVTLDLDLGTGVARGARVQIPARFVQGNPALSSLSTTAGVAGVLRATHTPPSSGPACGYFSSLKRNIIGNQFAAKVADVTPMPVVFLRQAGNSLREVQVVEALNTQAAGITSPIVIGAQTVNIANPVKRRANLCCGPGTRPEVCGADSTSDELVDCYELAATYVSYDENGQQILHLPECNDPLIPKDSPDCVLPENDRCEDPIKAPVCGDLQVSIIPVSAQSILGLIQPGFGEWDGHSTNKGQVILYTTKNGSIDMNTTYDLPTIRVPAAGVQAVVPQAFGTPGGVLSVVLASHSQGSQQDAGFFSNLKRNVVFSHDIGNAFDVFANPLIFTKNPQGADEEEVIMLEPRHISLVTAGPAGAQLPVAECVNFEGTDYYEFGITHVSYDNFGTPRIHQKGSTTLPITGGLKVSVVPNGVNTPVSRVWESPFPTASLLADTTPNMVFDVQEFPKSALVRIEKEAIVGLLPPMPQAPNLVVGTVVGTHCDDPTCMPPGPDEAFGYYNAPKRNVIHTQALANELDNFPTPLFFRRDGECMVVTVPQ